MRNAEVIRQWKILKRIEAGRYTTAQDLADEHGVTERTIRRDIEALQEAGFPLYDERVDTRKIWRLVEGYKQRLTQTFTLAELSALYFSKNLMSFRGAPFAQDWSGLREEPRGLPARSLPYLPASRSSLRRPDPGILEEQASSPPHRRALQRAGAIAYFSSTASATRRHRRPLPAGLLPRRPLHVRCARTSTRGVRTFAVERSRPWR